MDLDHLAKSDRRYTFPRFKYFLSSSNLAMTIYFNDKDMF
jgi:hypothetical protein